VSNPVVNPVRYAVMDRKLELQGGHRVVYCINRMRSTLGTCVRAALVIRYPIDAICAARPMADHVAHRTLSKLLRDVLVKT
jgi:hypothetical protein